LFQQFLESLDKKDFEIKRDMFRNGRLVVEIEQKHRDQDWKPSGLSVTTAKWWVYLFSDDSFLAVEVQRLKKYIEVNSDMEKKTFAPRSYNPTRGYLLQPEDVSKLMASELYDTKER
jgi:hypothetical protein